MLVDPGRTPYDLCFRLFGFPIRVHPFFWLGAGLLGADILSVSPANWLIWIVVVFVSILVHEMGHAIAYRWFRSPASIVLYAFGGLATPHYPPLKRWKRIIVALAGPFAGFLLSAAAFGSLFLVRWSEYGSYVAFFVGMLIFVNLWWGVFNLLPVFPLDGGQVCREVCEAGSRNGTRLSLQISVWVAIAVATYSVICVMESKSGHHTLLQHIPWWFPRGGMWTAILFGILAMQSYQLLQQIGRGYYYEAPDDRTPWER